MPVQKFPIDVLIGGNLSMGTIQVSPEAVSDQHVKGAANIAETKLQHRVVVRYAQAGGTNIADGQEIVYTMQAGGTIAAVQAFIETPPTGDGNETTVDVHKSTGAGAFATVLSDVITFAQDTNDAYSVSAADIASAAVADGDTLKIIIDAAATNPGQGICVIIVIHEDGT